MARNFDGSDEVILSIGACNGSFGTLAAIVYPTALNVWQAAIGIKDATSTYQITLELSNTGQISYSQGGGGNQCTTALPAANEWYILAITKATDVVTPRAHWYRFSDNSWTHENCGSTTGDGAETALGTIHIGQAETDWWTGEIAAAASWATALSDAAIEELAGSFPSWYTLEPKGFWILDQDAVGSPVLDITGGHADQSSLTGTAVSTISVPVMSYGAQVVSVESGSAAAMNYTKTVNGQLLGATRDVYLQPFADDSPWNTPIGDQATYVDAQLVGFGADIDGQYLESEVVAIVPDITIPAYPGDGASCQLTPSGAAYGTWYAPSILVTDITGEPVGFQPNGSGAQLTDDLDTLQEGQWMASDGTAVAAPTKVVYGIRRGTHSIRGSGMGLAGTPGFDDPANPGAYTVGGHGGSGMTGVGGTLRKWEINEGVDILHPLKVSLCGGYLYGADGVGFRWPATVADTGFNGSARGVSVSTDATHLTRAAVDPAWTTNGWVGSIVYSGWTYGTITANTNTELTVSSWNNGTPTSGKGFIIGGNANIVYHGIVPEVQMGTLLAIPDTFDVTTLTNWASFSALEKKIAYCLQNFGAYVIDEAYGYDQTVATICVESGITPTFTLAHLVSMWAELSAVSNNAIDNPGGPGNRIATGPLSISSGGSMSGTLDRSFVKTIAGVVGTLTGAVVKKASKSAAGIMGALTGGVTLPPYVGIVYFQEMFGEIATIAGTTAKTAKKTLTGVAGSTTGAVTTLLSTISTATVQAGQGIMAAINRRQQKDITILPPNRGKK